jgi:2-iminobutanoate/2-iminopropanoate deaminase
LLFVSGQGPRDPATGAVAQGIEAETEQVLKNLKTIVVGAGYRLEDALQARVYLTHIQDFEAMNRVYRRYFPAEPPARTTVAVSALPLVGTRVEIDLLVGKAKTASAGRSRAKKAKPRRRRTR